ncbi:hypothetical protein [Desulfocucumis palustris]|uniref:hypothetical protein n=1 Tax=Desulfocucumis palustris TaxID=1898651 RepID=UPI001A9A5E6E|nr:hypothetical protein [Desulfocucumis palustris]
MDKFWMKMGTAIQWNDISPNFRPNSFDTYVATKLLEYEGSPRAVIFFDDVCDKLTDYSYWFFLGTIWVSYSGKSELQLWKRLFASKRATRLTSIMKPSELAIFNTLPNNILVYRAHRYEEKDWISYTLDQAIATRFARERKVNEISLYRLRRRDVIALFLRRGEQEIIMLQTERAKLIEKMLL